MLRHTRIALDFDDVLLAAAQPFWEFCRARGRGVEWRSATRNLLQLMACEGDQNRDAARALIDEWRAGPWLALHEAAPPKSCVAALAKLCACGAELHVISARKPHEAALTQRYVDRFLAPYIRSVHCTQDKARVCAELGCTALVDDDPQQLAAVAQSGVEAVPFGKAPWTCAFRSPVRRCNSWAKLVDWLTVQVLVVGDAALCDELLRAGVSAAEGGAHDRRVPLLVSADGDQCWLWRGGLSARRRWPRSQLVALLAPK